MEYVGRRAVPTTLAFDDAVVGVEAPPRQVVLGRTDFVRYAGASGDLNPMHHDEVRAHAAGMPSVFGHGMLSAGVLAGAVTEWVGVEGLTRFAVRFTKQVWPDVPMTCRVEITAVRPAIEGGGSVDLLCRLVGPDGEIVVRGEASARLRPRP
jgi:acyl dehydratase